MLARGGLGGCGVAWGIKGKLLKKFSLKIPFKIFHASAKGRASLLPLARVNEKILAKVFSGILHINDFTSCVA